jgi:HK97 family phage portal protein
MVAPVQPGLVTDPGTFGLDLIAWKGQAVGSLLHRGNAYGIATETDSQANVTRVRWLHPDLVTVDESQAAPRYYVNGREIPREIIIHIPGICPPGSVVGLSPVSLFRTEIETGLRAGELARQWYKDGSAPSSILYRKDRPLVAGEGAVAKARFKQAVKDHDVLVTGNDWGYLPLSISPADARFLEQSQAIATTVGAIFHVAPEEIGGQSGSSMTYSTLESNDLRYSRKAVRPTAERFESAITRLLPDSVYVKFNFDALVRSELKARMDSYAVALDNGILTLDEVRALEDRAPLTPEQVIAWQDQYVVPRPNGAGDTKAARQDSAARLLQQVYLAVGTVITSDEARAIVNASGSASLPLPGPVFTSKGPS